MYRLFVIISVIISTATESKAQSNIELRGQTGYNKVFYKNIFAELSARYFIHERISAGINFSMNYPGIDASYRHFDRHSCQNNLSAFYYGLGGEYYLNMNKLQGYFGLNINITHYEYSCYYNSSDVPKWYDFENTVLWVIPRLGLKYELSEKWSAFTEFGYGFNAFSTLKYYDALQTARNINAGVGISRKL